MKLAHTVSYLRHKICSLHFKHITHLGYNNLCDYDYEFSTRNLAESTEFSTRALCVRATTTIQQNYILEKKLMENYGWANLVHRSFPFSVEFIGWEKQHISSHTFPPLWLVLVFSITYARVWWMRPLTYAMCNSALLYIVAHTRNL